MATTFENSTNHDPEPQQSNRLSRLLAQTYLINWEVVGYVVIFVLAVFTRFYMLGERVMSHDESLHTRYSYDLAERGTFRHTPLMHGPILFHFTALFYFLFGANDFTSRIYPAILGVAVVMMPILFRRWLGRWGAMLASIMLLISPITMYYNRYIRHDTPNIFFSLLMIYGMFMYLSGPDNQRRREHWLYLIAGSMLMNLGSKETAFIYIAIIGIYLVIYWLIRLIGHLNERDLPDNPATSLVRFLGRFSERASFYTIMMAFAVGGIAALGMFATLSINLGERPFFQAITTLTSYSTFITWMLVVIASVSIPVGITVIWGFKDGAVRFRAIDGVVFFALSFLFSTVLIWAEELSRLSHNTTGISEPVIPGQSLEVVTNAISQTPIIAIWVIAAFVIGMLWVSWRRGWWQYVVENFPEFDLIILIGALILPWATPIIIYATGMTPTNYTGAGYLQVTITSLIPMIAISMALGLMWNWRKWTISLAIFYALFAFFFTTMFTNPDGLASGLIGSLGYWLEQQGVRRGNQPQYYYVAIIMPMYEYLPVLGSIFAMFSGLTWFWRFRSREIEQHQERREAMLAAVMDNESTDDVEITEPTKPKRYSPTEGKLQSMPFLPFVVWWGMWNLIGYTLAGEKMPWLAIHLSLPLILLTGWFFGRIFNRVDGQLMRKTGWIYLFLVPLFYVLVARLLAPFIFGEVPFVGLRLTDLAQTGEWIAVFAIIGLVVFAILQLVERTGFAHLRHMIAVSTFIFLSVLTLRAAWMASFINYDLANEFLVYAHAAPAVKTVLNDIEELSLRTTDGMDLSFVYDNEVSWPYSWYFRDFPNGRFVGDTLNAQQADSAVAVVVGDANRAKFEPLLEDRYYRYEYIRLWWPMQDYFGLTPQRVSNTLGLGTNELSGQLRKGIWDIWWMRDYTTYGLAVNRDFNLTRWPVSDRMHFYVRKDIAAQIWNLGVGDGLVSNPLENSTTNMCNANWLPNTANLIFEVPADAVALNEPIGIALASDGNVYVSEQWNHRISVFAPDGTYIESFGERGGPFEQVGADDVHSASLGLFERPNALAIAPDDSLYVVDTWNFRVQKFDENGEPLFAWGQRDERGASVETIPVDGFWGPRDAVVDERGRVFIADTGNKRIRVYTSEGDFLFDIGSAGALEGQLNEPTGLALDDEGRLYVADTWNRRISVFDTDTAEHLYSFRVRAWYNDQQGNRPYIAIDNARGLLYVGDPDAGRVLVHNLNGDCVGSFGQAGTAGQPLAANQFVVVGGIEVDDAGNVYVVDSRSGRISRYAPFELPPEMSMSESDEVIEAVESVDDDTSSDNSVSVPLNLGDDEAEEQSSSD